MESQEKLEGRWERARGDVLAEWLARLEGERLLMGEREAVANVLSAWLELLGAAAQGDEASARELYKLVAFHARQLGADGKPASAAFMQAALLEDALEASLPAPKVRAAAPVVRELLRVVVDAHALGATERTKSRHLLEIRDFSPVVHLDSRTVLGFLLGPMDPDLVDAMMGRVLREASRTQASRAILDVFGASRDTDSFHHAILAFQRHEVGGKVELVLSGLRDLEATRQALGRIGCKVDRLRFSADVNAAIAGHVASGEPAAPPESA